MASFLLGLPFQPVLTGPLLWALTRGSPDLKERILAPLASLPFAVDQGLLVTSLKWLFALGVVSKVNGWLNAWALNKWAFSANSGAKWDLPKETLVITGGSGGIATEIIKNVAVTGMKIAIMDVQAPPAGLKELRNVHFYQCDITDSKAVHEAAVQIKAELGTPTILLNNAGIGRTANITDVTDAFLEKIFHINLISHWYTVREFLPGMLAARKGHIIATASMASFVAVPGMVDYCVTKAGVMSFHEGLNQELKHRYKAPYIKTTCVHPYWVRTALLGDWERRLASEGHPIMTPEYAGKQIANVVLKGSSGRLVLPGWSRWLLEPVSGMRGWPHWLLEVVNDTQSEIAK